MPDGQYLASSNAELCANDWLNACPCGERERVLLQYVCGDEEVSDGREDGGRMGSLNAIVFSSSTSEDLDVRSDGPQSSQEANCPPFSCQFFLHRSLC